VQILTPVLGQGHEAPPETRLTPGYYVRSNGLDPFIAHLLADCRTVTDIKGAMVQALTALLAGAAPEGGDIEDGADVDDLVVVQPGARVEAGARVSGPVLVCSGTVIARGAWVRDHSIVGPGCRIGAGAEITRSLLAGHDFMVHSSFVGDSVLGQHVNVGAFCSTTGLLCTSGPVTEPATREITINLDGHRIGTGQTKFGAVVGDAVALPAATVLAPGTLIGPGTVLYPRTQIGGVLPAGSVVR
jgi:bifunctional UDP-N-acetylglucosamine pyrophosphorylase/glucosamine-1-phosphate N-acetyltransferase